VRSKEGMHGAVLNSAGSQHKAGDHKAKTSLLPYCTVALCELHSTVPSYRLMSFSLAGTHVQDKLPLIKVEVPVELAHATCT
jgi:hypothetical protein